MSKSTQIRDTVSESKTLATEVAAMKRLRKDLAHERKLLARERRLAIPRTGAFESLGQAMMTLEEAAFKIGYSDKRTALKKLQERNVPVDDYGDGHMMIVVDQWIEAQREYMRGRITCDEDPS